MSKKTKAPKVQAIGYEFIVVLSGQDAEGEGEAPVKKQKYDRHGCARRAAHRHLLKSETNVAGIITLFTPHTMKVDERGFLQMIVGETIVKGIQDVSRYDAEGERMQEVANKLRDTTAYEAKKPSPAVGKFGPSDKPQTGRHWQKGFSEYRAWDKSRKPQGLSLQKG